MEHNFPFEEWCDGGCGVPLSRKLSELGSCLGFRVQGLGVRPGLPGRASLIPELRRHGLWVGPHGVSRWHLERLRDRFFTPLVYNRYVRLVGRPCTEWVKEAITDTAQLFGSLVSALTVTADKVSWSAAVTDKLEGV